MIGLALTLCCDLTSHQGWAPFIHAEDKHFATFALAGFVSVEWAGPTRIDRLKDLGCIPITFAADSRKPPFSWFMQRGKQIHLFWLELLLAMAVYVFLLRPFWKSKRLAKLGLCSMCEYQVIGVASERCPECGNTIAVGTVRDEAALPASSRANRIKRWLIEVPFIFILLLMFQIVVNATTRYEDGHHLALNPRSDVISIRSGETIRLTHSDGISYLTMTAIRADHWEYHVDWWGSGQHLQEIRGAVCEGCVSNCIRQTSIAISNDTIEWSMGGSKRSWLYLTQGGTSIEASLPIHDPLPSPAPDGD